jgi:hypothetical protein
MRPLPRRVEGREGPSFSDWGRNTAIRPAGFLQKPLAVQSTLDKTSTTLPRSKTLVGSTRARTSALCTVCVQINSALARRACLCGF